MQGQVYYVKNGMGGRPFRTNPELVRSGTASDEFSEMTPVIFRNRMHLLGSAHAGARANPYDDRCLWVEEVATGKVISTFAEGYGLGSAFADGDALYVYAIHNDSHGAQQIECFKTKDLQDWELWTVIEALPGEELFNESVCRAGGRCVMAYESRDANYPPFTIYFAESEDLVEWRRIPGAVFGTDRYTACPSIRYLDGMFYMLYTEHLKPRWWFETYLTRSPDLIHWEQSPKNPVLDPEGIEGINTSDVDLVEYREKGEDRVRLYYATGNQRTWGTVTWADFKGTQREFFDLYFPPH